MADQQGPVQNQASIDTIVSLLQSMVSYLGDIVTAIDSAFPRVLGTFTMAAASTFVVSSPTIAANSSVQITPRNAVAATLQSSSKSLYVSTISPGSGFTVATADGTAAAGTELFLFAVTNPV